MLPGVEQKQLRLVKETGAFQKEVEAHFALLPAMKLFVEENESLNGRAGGRVWPLVPVPQIVYGAYDDADGTGIIALMDLRESGFLPLSHYSGMNLAQVLTVAEKVAEFHAVGSAMLMNNNGEKKEEEDLAKQFRGREEKQ